MLYRPVWTPDRPLWRQRLISVVLGRRESGDLHIDLWLNELPRAEARDGVGDAGCAGCACPQAGLGGSWGGMCGRRRTRWWQSIMNGFGFSRLADSGVEGESLWELETAGYRERNRHIRVPEPMAI